MGFFYSLNLTSGLLFTSIMGLWLNWRWITCICTLEPIIFLFGLLFIPESPYFLVKNGLFKKNVKPSLDWKLNSFNWWTGRTDDAARALEWLRGSRYNIQVELHQIETRVQNDRNHIIRFANISYPWAYKPVLIGIILMVLQQFSGMNAASFNSAEIFRIADLGFDRLVGVVLINATQVFMIPLLLIIFIFNFVFCVHR